MATGHQLPPKAPPPLKAVSGSTPDATSATQQDTEPTQPINMTLVARIQGLSVGECCSESRFIDFNTTDRETLDQVIKALRSTVNKAVSRAAVRTSGQYSTVTGHYMTRDNNIVVVATALRTG